MPRPAVRGGEISDEVLTLFERALQLRASKARRAGVQNCTPDEALHDELIRVEKKLVWSLLPRLWPGWGPWAPSPADAVLDGECFMSRGHYLHQVWPQLQEGRRVLLEALAERLARRG